MALPIGPRDFNEVLGYYCVIRGPSLYVLSPLMKDRLCTQGHSQGITASAEFVMRISHPGDVHYVGEMVKNRYSGVTTKQPHIKKLEEIKRIYLKKAKQNG